MKQIINNILKINYLWKAVVIIVISLTLCWLFRENLIGSLYMLIFGGWALNFLYVRMYQPDETDF